MYDFDFPKAPPPLSSPPFKFFDMDLSPSLPSNLGFGMGIPQVRNFNTAPAHAYTIPFSGTGTYRTILVMGHSRCHVKPAVSSLPVGYFCITNYYETTNDILQSMKY